MKGGKEERGRGGEREGGEGRGERGGWGATLSFSSMCNAQAISLMAHAHEFDLKMIYSL